VRVALHVAELVVAPVIGDPLRGGALDRDRTGYGKRDAQPAFRFE